MTVILFALHLCYCFITENLVNCILFEFFTNAFPLRKCINTNWKLCVVRLHTIELHLIRQHMSKLPTITPEIKLPATNDIHVERIHVATRNYKQVYKCVSVYAGRNILYTINESGDMPER